MKTRKIKLTVLSLLLAVTTTFAGGYKVDSSQSKITWKAKKVTGEHYGNVSLKDGEFAVENGQITGGTFTSDMNTFTVDDLQGEWHDKLLGHLKSDDFFSVEKHSTSTLKVTNVTKKSGNNYAFTGDLTIKGITHPITFDAVVEMSGDVIKASGTMTVDRTNYDIKFRSGKFFPDLGDKLIYDDFTLEYNIVAKK